MEETTTTTTTQNPDVYRFSGLRYSIRGPDACGSDEIIPQETGLYGFPKSDSGTDEDE